MQQGCVPHPTLPNSPDPKQKRRSNKARPNHHQGTFTKSDR